MMTSIKNSLFVLMAAMVSLPGEAALVDFHFGNQTETGPAVLGAAGDHWNSTDVSKGGPLLLEDVAGNPTSISVTWNSGNAWGTRGPIFSDNWCSPMDAATTWLMRSYAYSYQYYPGPTNLGLNISGLVPDETYTLVLLGAGDQPKEGTQFTITGTGTFTGATTAHNRKISAGPGDAYISLSVVSSAQGTLKITTEQNGYHFAILNGFQLIEGTAATASAASSTNSTADASARSIAWGVCGHPTWTDYSNYIPANVTTQINYLKELGCKYYRCSFEPTDGPYILEIVAPQAEAAGITVLPNLPLWLSASAGAQGNYNTNYQTAYKWASYAISKGYDLPFWELGNEVENYGLVSVVYDGASPNDFPDIKPGGFVAIATGLKGAYQGIKDAYAAGRASGLTTITPQCLFGATFRHWGLLTKIQAYDGTLPCDIISWHWYGPCYGVFNQPIVDSNSVSNGRTPYACLNDFKSHTDLSQPMDIWITETNRSQKISATELLNGSTGSNTNPRGVQDWAAEAAAIQANVDSFKVVPSVKGIFVYELFDETKSDSSSTELLASEGYFGLVTGLNGILKPAFYTYQTEIKTGP